MESIRIMIIEDDMVIATDLQLFLEELEYTIVEVLDSGEDGLEKLQTEGCDLILLDINLAGKLDGINTAALIRARYDLPIIFLTANEDLETLERAKTTAPEAYLVKPFNTLSLRSAIEIAAGKIYSLSKPLENVLNLNSGQESIFLKTGKRLQKVKFEEVLFIEANDIYADLYTAEKQHFVGHSLRFVTENFPSLTFLRVHRSYVVNLKKIEAIEDRHILIGEHRIPIGKTYREKLLEKIEVI